MTRPRVDAPSPSRSRLDQLLVERGLFDSREKARRAIMAGLVVVNEARVDKAGAQVKRDAHLRVKFREPFVSRAGRKLAGALDHFGLDPAGMVCLDVGASTGGFTQCLLESDAVRVYALDVGYGQLAAALRNDPRVVVMERVNARYLEPDALPELVDLATVDVSFISLTKIVPAVLHLVRPGGYLLPMIKPQFEVGRGLVGKGGVVRDEELRLETIEQRLKEFRALGVEVIGWCDNEVTGSSGNREAFALLRRPLPVDGSEAT